MGICSDCYTGSNTINLSDLTCTSVCAIADYFVSQSGLRYCKEREKTVTFTDNSAATPCTLTGSFGSDYFNPTKSEWSSSAFLIENIVDSNILAKAFTFTVTGLGATPAGLNSFQVNFTQPNEFDAHSKDLNIVLSACKSFGVLQTDSTVAKITGTATINNFKCNPTCTGATKYLDVDINTCVSACGSQYIGISSAKGSLCLTQSQCDSDSLVKDSLQLICSDCTSNNSSHSI